MNIIEDIDGWRRRFAGWQPSENLSDYPFVRNRRAPFTPARRALPMLNLALISSAGAYIDGRAVGVGVAAPDSRNAVRSFLVTRPEIPLPLNAVMSTPCSAAIRLTSGDDFVRSRSSREP